MWDILKHSPLTAEAFPMIAGIGVVAVALFVYLLIALAHPEWFS